ncbi:hypothetical protein HGB25_00565 [Candidatus Saccharibacteria bacterium]|nr:hypothetical protein [Candidatus Saccharibacteria bacterium]
MSERIKPSVIEKGHDFRKATRVDIGDQVIRMDDRNRQRVTERVRASLEPGTPIYLETIGCGHGLLAQPYTTAAVFLSDGTMDSCNRFGMRQGLRNTAWVNLGRDGGLITHVHSSAGPYHESLSPPSNGYSQTWNEGTFSPSGGSYHSSYHASGTARLIIGEKVNVLTEALDRIKFAEESMIVSAPSFYSTAGEYILRKCDIKRPRQQQDAERQLMLDQELLAFALKMLKLALAKKDHDFDSKSQTLESRQKHAYFQGSIHAREFASYSDGDTPFRATTKDHEITPSDYIVYEPNSPLRRLGYLRPTPHSGLGNNGLFLPQNRVMERIANLAFDPNFIQTHYPQQ